MNFDARLTAYRQDVQRLGIPTAVSLPVFYRLMVRARIRVRPPLYWPFAYLVGFFTGVAALFWGSALRLVLWLTSEHAIALPLFWCGIIVGSGIFGHLAAALYFWQARKSARVPAWSL